MGASSLAFCEGVCVLELNRRLDFKLVCARHVSCFFVDTPQRNSVLVFFVLNLARSLLHGQFLDKLSICILREDSIFETSLLLWFQFLHLFDSCCDLFLVQKWLTPYIVAGLSRVAVTLTSF